ncbi:MAG: OB-fold nucleic acid binding domain-containing protein [Candidatus Bathyarchaeia archaeon]
MEVLGEIGDIINRIVASKPGLTSEKVKAMIEEKKKSYHGLLTDEGAAHLVAQDLGVTVDYTGGRSFRLKDLVSGLKDVSIEAPIIYVGEVKRFKRRQGEGKVLRLVLDDGSKQLNCVLWDDKVDEFLSTGPTAGWRIKILHGYTKSGTEGVEVHVGSRGSIKLEKTSNVQLPVKKVASLTADDRVFILEVFIVSKSDLKTFKANNREGRVLRVNVKDGSGFLTLVLWNDAADRVVNVEDGSKLRILGGKVRFRATGGLELHINDPGKIEIMPFKARLEDLVSKVVDLKPNAKGLTLLLRAYSKTFTRVFKTPSGVEGRVASLLAGDDTGLILINFWGKMSYDAEEVKEGDVFMVKNAYTRMGLRGMEVHVGLDGVLEKRHDVSNFKVLNLTRKVGELRDGDRYVTLEGMILTTPEARKVDTAKGEVKVASFIIGDDTGSIRVTVWRELAEECEKLEAGTVVRLTHLYIRSGPSGELEASTTRFSGLVVVEKAG